MTLRIEDYALIGDCETAALVGRNGSIDWLCWPRFDSPACFAALLGDPGHGRWLIAPRDSAVRVTRRYRERTLILETTLETNDGAVTVIDFMPLRSGMGSSTSDLVRLVRGERGRVRMRVEFLLRCDYGGSIPWVSRLENGALRAIAGPDMTVLYTPVHLKGENLRHTGEFTIAAGDTVPFILAYGPSHLPLPQPANALTALEETERFWRDWAGQCRAAGEWSEAVARSLITLKALTYSPTGGIVAAPTTSLPERIGGVRNWDYRYCWLRDATLTLLALMNAGYFDEAHAWREWLLRAVAGSPDQLQIMYGIAGERRLDEWVLRWLPGYENSRPVRVGNAACNQFQLDVFGEVMDALHQARRGGLSTNESGWSVELELLKRLANIWHEPDQGIWEIRGPPRHFTHSKVMAWVAFDRAIKSAEAFGLEGPIETWQKLRATICDDILAKGYDPEMNSFVQSYGSKHLDANLLLLPSLGFISASDPRMAGTVAAIERRLMRDGLVLRYDTEATADGLPAGEGAFLACTFWLADVYILQNRWDEANRLFRNLLTFRNDVGLLSEEYDVASGRQLGNFPQAFSHVALVDTAFNLTRAAETVTKRAEPEPVGETTQLPHPRQ